MTVDPAIPARAREAMLTSQRNEITEHHIYQALAEKAAEATNRKVLDETAAVELGHYRFFRSLTGVDIAPDRARVAFYLLVYRVFGITFSLKFMERGEVKAQKVYRDLLPAVPGLEAILRDEERHEKELIALVDEQRLQYTGAMVLGLNDALVELTGTLAGLTLALQDTRVIAMAGLITGIAAALSMASAEYLSTKSEGGAKNPFRAAMYTGIAYIVTVLFLVAPYLVFANYYLALAVTIVNAIIVILVFTFYISVTRDLDYRGRFIEMAGLSLGVAALSFIVGILVRVLLGVNV
ncbi:MAG TPA: VIT1/CCC1 transporter family protein [Methanomicrobiales archaeon]|jgi:VIT1/CCC1 family predicted Fe2+/Mn2+ transporter|nr:VIT1/CCC1 transporter family protein [Methanomicrobiales archaeon]